MATLGSLFALPLSFYDCAVVYNAKTAAACSDLSAPGGQPHASGINADENGSAVAHHHTSDASLVKSVQQLALFEDRRAGVWSEAGATCITCGLGVGPTDPPGFSCAADQRAHFRSDWHRYNVKRRVAKQPPVTEEAFEKLLEAESEVSSISGSESDGSDGFPTVNEEDENDEEEGRAGGTARRRGAQAPPRCVFWSVEKSKPFAVWRCLLTDEPLKRLADGGQDAQLLDELRHLRRGGRTWVVLLLVGGHFAGAVLRPASSGSSKNVLAVAGGHSSSKSAMAGGPKGATGGPAVAGAVAHGPAAAAAAQTGCNSGTKQKPTVVDGFEVVAHKTFHRYVVRAKGGGKQSTKDGTGKVARSVGSRLRRYHEAALDKEIDELLLSWREHLDASSLVLVHAPSSNMKSLFPTSSDSTASTSASSSSTAAYEASRRQQYQQYNEQRQQYEEHLQQQQQGSTVSVGGGPVLAPPAPPPAAFGGPNDRRVRRIPFTMRRPTHNEVLRVVKVLTTVYEADVIADTPPPTDDVKCGTGKPNANDRQAAGRGGEQGVPDEGQDAGGRGEGRGASGGAETTAGEATTSGRQDLETPLHRAARANDDDAIATLLAGGADPGALNAAGRPPYLLCSGKAARDAFRRFMASEPTRWDYTAAGIPSALTEEMEAAQKSKEAEKKAKLRAKDKERKKEAEDKRQAAAAAAVVTLDDEIAAAVAEAAALAGRSTGAGTKAAGKLGASTSKVGGRTASAAGSGTAGRGGAGGARPPPAAQVVAAAPMTAAEAARRREAAAAAAEARMKALQQAAAQQKLW